MIQPIKKATGANGDQGKSDNKNIPIDRRRINPLGGLHAEPQTRRIKPNEQLQNILDFADAGLCLIPVRCDGSKAPAIDKWGAFAKRKPSQTEYEHWFGRQGEIGTAIVCGITSNGIEVLDFDIGADRVFDEWYQSVEDIACRLPVVETPSFGRHVFYRCLRICGNKKIATQPRERGVDTLIESRGQGGYVVSVLSPISVHSAGYPYVQVMGPPLPDIPTITPDERKRLWEAAEAFDRSNIREQVIAKLQRKEAPQKRSGPLTPWDDYNHRGDWFGLLQRHGWTSVDGVHWRHPDAKSNGHSATLRVSQSGDQVLHVFTTSTVLDSEKSHSLYSVFTMLEHGGDFAKAAKELRGAGYGR